MNTNNAMVFIPQQTLKRNAEGELVAAHDITPALRYGTPVVLLGSGAVMLNTEPMMFILLDKMKDFSDADYVLGIGDPAAIAATIMVASWVNYGRVKLLRWDRNERQYLPLQFDLNERKNDGNN